MTKPPNSKWKLPPHARIDAMAAAFEKLSRRLAERNESLARRSDELMDKMAELETSLGHAADVERQVKVELAEIRMKIAEEKDGLAAFEADIALSVSAEILEGKLRYSNEPDRKRATLVALNADKEWKSRKDTLRGREFEKARKEAELGEIEKTDRANRARYAGLRAQLENLTKRF